MSVLLLLNLAVAVASGAAPPVDVQALELLGRLELPSPAASLWAGTVGKDAPLQTLVDYVAGSHPDRDRLSPEGFLRRRVDALEVLGSRSNLTASPRPVFWTNFDAAMRAADSLRRGEDDARFRRFALMSLFVDFGLTARIAVVHHPQEGGWRARWAKVERLRKALLADKDPKLREFMERYRRQNGKPRLRLARDRARRLNEVLVKAYPAQEAQLREAFRLAASAAEDTDEVTAKVSRGIADDASIPPEMRQAAVRISQEIGDWQSMTAYTNQYPSLAVFSVDPEGDERLEVSPVRFGWPDLGPLMALAKP